MSIGPLTDVVTRAAYAALDGVALRQRVVADNIANSATPGYREKQVTFEDALGAAMSTGSDPMTVAADVSETGSPVKADGNSVDVTRQATLLDETTLQYQALVQVLNFRANIIKDGLNR